MVVVAEQHAEFVAIPLEGLAGMAPLDFAVFLDTGLGRKVLYRDARTRFDESHLSRLRAEGVPKIYIQRADRANYYRRVETGLDTVLRDRSAALETRVDVLLGVALHVADEVLVAVPDAAQVARGQKLMTAAATLVVREPKGFDAIRHVLQAGGDLPRHSLTVGLLSMGLARQMLGPEPTVLVRAGLAGLLHDIGRIGHSDVGSLEDPEHTKRGAHTLQGLGMHADVINAALCHHERADGGGYPRGLRGTQIPELARIVGIVNTFDRVYSTQQATKLSVFDALRILAEVYRGFFDERLAVGLVQVFRS